jgi:DNA repair photolyase
MNIIEVQAKSILRRHKKVDSWFVSCYGMNFYRGCQHNCVYCDGRAEGYYVEGEFGRNIAVKTNTIELLRREIDPARKRTPFKRCFIMVGGGVGDSYQPIEEKYRLTRQALELLYERDWPVSLLTKATLIRRDIDIIERINKKTRALVSFSLSSADDKISRIFEPGVPTPTERLKTIAIFKERGIACGIFLMPVIPFITDNLESIEEVMDRARGAGVDFIVFSGMTLKPGRQQDYFFKVLGKNFPKLVPRYKEIYLGDKWGNAQKEYYDSIHRLFGKAAAKYKIPRRIPAIFFKDILAENDLVVVMLEQIDYLLRLKGAKSPYGYAAYSISKIEEPVSKMGNRLREIRGVGRAVEEIIKEIVKTKTCSLYERLMRE